LNSKRRKILLCMPVRPLLGVVVISFSLMFLVPAGSDAKSPQETKLIASDSEANDHFGIAVAIDGNCAIIGSACDDDMGTDSGSAYIFRWDGTDWVQQQKLVAADGLDGDWFGCSVSISGDYAIVGTRYGDSDVAVDSGTAYVFWNNGTSWVQQAKLMAKDALSGACFGISVHIDGHKAIVGSFCTIDGGTAYIFRRDGANWSQEKRLMAMDSAPGDSFGRSVVVEADKAVVGADGYENKGSAYVFLWDGNDWAQEQKLIAPDIETYDYFGRSVSMSNGKVIVGSYWDDDSGTDSGSAYVYEWDGKEWVFKHKLTASDGAAKDWFGYSVSLQGDYVIIGADGCDDKGSDAGSAYLFWWDGTKWVQQRKLTSSDAKAQSWFGRSVCISGDRVIVGAVLDDEKGVNSGSASIFEPVRKPTH
jgi:hypothetical protein